jgi:pyruvate/2-oxoglutarate dehydrogenase complex dihydrolipoamide acyltransferase (E2) component
LPRRGAAQGLVTPVVRGVERMSYLDVERTLYELSVKARVCTSHSVWTGLS